jgi:hypothetical protein
MVQVVRIAQMVQVVRIAQMVQMVQVVQGCPPLPGGERPRSGWEFCRRGKCCRRLAAKDPAPVGCIAAGPGRSNGSGATHQVEVSVSARVRPDEA